MAPRRRGRSFANAPDASRSPPFPPGALEAALNQRDRLPLFPLANTNASRGCSKSTPTYGVRPGGFADIHYASLQQPFRLSLPLNYDPRKPSTMLVHFHGWGGNLQSGMPFHEDGMANGYVVVTPLGYDDEGTKKPSWNGAGTAEAPPPGTHQTCYDPTHSFANLCYTRSCGPRGGCNNNSCAWTTCEDSVAQTARLLDELERSICFDPRRVFASGVSNGGIFLYELAVSPLATQFAGFMPIVGSPHVGFNRAPRGGAVPFFGVWGRADGIVPPVHNPAAKGHPGPSESAIAQDTFWGGWRFATASAVSQLWAASNGCTSAAAESAVETCAASASCAIAAAHGADCVGWRTGCTDDALVLKCLHPGGHELPSWVPVAHRAFMRDHARRSASLRLPGPPPTHPQPFGHAIVYPFLLLMAAAVAVCAALLSFDSPFRRSSRSRDTINQK